MVKTINSINPRTNELIAKFDFSDDEQILQAIKKLRIGQSDWAKQTINSRLKKLKVFRNLLIAKQDEISQTIADEIGKSEYEALIGEQLLTVLLSNDLIRNAKSVLKTSRLRHRFLKIKKSYLIHEPHGVVAVISPWNYPFILSLTAILSALVAGNTVIYKPSEYSSDVGRLIQDLLKQAGFTEDVFQIVYGDGEVGKAVVQSDINKIVFTGSVVTGKSIATEAAKRLIPTTLELGGKDPMIVLNSANLRRAARSAIWSGTFNGGQTCAGIERIIVQKDVYEPMLTLLKSELDQLNLENNLELSPINNEKQFKQLQKQLKDAEKSAAELYQKNLPESFSGEYKIAPTLIIKPNESANVVMEESFGPIMTVEQAEDLNDAIRLANLTDFGLSASVFSTDKKVIKQINTQLKFGSVYINDHLAPQGGIEAPWGGVKQSGIGRTRGAEGLLAMTQTKHVSIDRLKLGRDIWWFPYSVGKAKFFKKLVKLARWIG